MCWLFLGVCIMCGSGIYIPIPKRARSGRSVADAQMSRVTRVLDASTVLASVAGLSSQEAYNRRDKSNRFLHQTFEQFWLYNEPM
jgi:hypothetical protein